jgi:hypothetical protein
MSLPMSTDTCNCPPAFTLTTIASELVPAPPRTVSTLVVSLRTA